MTSFGKKVTTNHLKRNLGLGQEDCQHPVIDEILCMVSGCALGTDACHWMFKQVSMVQGQHDFPLKSAELLGQGRLLPSYCPPSRDVSAKTLTLDQPQQILDYYLLLNQDITTIMEGKAPISTKARS